MIDLNAQSENKGGLNIWISLTDLFAGLFLISLMGIGVLVHQLHQLKIENESMKREVRFSRQLLDAMHQATDTTRIIRSELEKSLPSLLEYSETEITIPSAARFGSSAFAVTEESQRDNLLKIRSAIRAALSQSGEKGKYLRIVIEGHTDSDNIIHKTKEIPTNWELSSLRATSVLRLFAGEPRTQNDPGAIPREKLMAVGLADTHPATFNPAEKDKNRRIVIRIEPDLEEIRKGIPAN